MQSLILAADDNEDNRVILRAILDHAGYAVIEATNGAEAVEAARRHHPSLVLMDIRMPVMDGWEAMARLRADAATQAIPVVALTAHDDQAQMEQKAQMAGFCAFVRKPILPRQILTVVRICLANAANGVPWADLRYLDLNDPEPPLPD